MFWVADIDAFLNWLVLVAIRRQKLSDKFT